MISELTNNTETTVFTSFENSSYILPLKVLSGSVFNILVPLVNVSAILLGSTIVSLNSKILTPTVNYLSTIKPNAKQILFLRPKPFSDKSNQSNVELSVSTNNNLSSKNTYNFLIECIKFLGIEVLLVLFTVVIFQIFKFCRTIPRGIQNLREVYQIRIQNLQLRRAQIQPQIPPQTVPDPGTIRLLALRQNTPLPPQIAQLLELDRRVDLQQPLPRGPIFENETQRTIRIRETIRQRGLERYRQALAAHVASGLRIRGVDRLENHYHALNPTHPDYQRLANMAGREAEDRLRCEWWGMAGFLLELYKRQTDLHLLQLRHNNLLRRIPRPVDNTDLRGLAAYNEQVSRLTQRFANSRRILSAPPNNLRAALVEEARDPRTVVVNTRPNAIIVHPYSQDILRFPHPPGTERERIQALR